MRENDRKNRRRFEYGPAPVFCPASLRFEKQSAGDGDPGRLLREGMAYAAAGCSFRMSLEAASPRPRQLRPMAMVISQWAASGR